MILKNGNQRQWCDGKKINVQINGIKKDSGNEAVTCEVDKMPVNVGQEVEWSNIKRNLGTCSNIDFDVSVGNEPKVQVKSDDDAYCPISVQLKINDIYFCGKTNQGDSNEFYGKGHNSIIHDTTRKHC